MNDADAMTAINEALDRWYKGEISEFQALYQVSRVTGLNRNAK